MPLCEGSQGALNLLTCLISSSSSPFPLRLMLIRSFGLLGLTNNPINPGTKTVNSNSTKNWNTSWIPS